MVWAKAGSDTLSSAGDTLTVSGMTASKFNIFLEHEIATGNIDNPKWTFNNNTNSVYADRVQTNGAADATSTNQTGVIVNLGNAAWDRFTVGYVCSISGEEKLLIFASVTGKAAGAGTAPGRNEQVAKFVPSPDASITRVDVTNGGSGDFDTSSNISALGSDLTPAAAVPFAENAQVGSRAEITDTRKIYHYEDPLTFEDDFSGTDDWTDSNSTYAGVNTTTDVLDFNVAASTTFDEASVYDLTSVSDTSWVLHCKLDVTTYTAISSGGTQTWAFGISSADQTEGQDGTNDFLGIRARITGSGLNQWELNDADGEGIGAVENADFTRGLSVETVYLELIRSGSTLTGRFWADSAHTVLLEQNILTIVGTVSSLRYLKVMAASVPGTGNGVFQGTVDEVKFWNGVTSAGNAWSEEGT